MRRPLSKQILASKIKKDDRFILENVPVIVRHWPKKKNGFVRVKVSADIPNAEIIELEFEEHETVWRI